MHKMQSYGEMNSFNENNLLEILEKRDKGLATPEELALLNAYFNAFKLRGNYTDTLNDHDQHRLREHLKEKIELGIAQAEEAELSIRLPRKRNWMSVAATLLVCTSAAVFFLNRQASQGLQPVKELVSHAEILPGGNKAILTLSDNSKISLADLKDGEIIALKGVKVSKKGGELVYELTNDTLSSVNELNTIETPRGGQFLVNLPDGTKVFLNALSSLTFPVSFSKSPKREVKITGEAYFEVTPDKLKPFKVTTDGQEVLVLGTHFNINAYSDEPAVITTLLEGSVRISHNGTSKMMKPGQQAIVKNDIVIKPQDENAVAWKNGITSFYNADIKTIMRQVSRWYNVDIEYEGNIPTRLFTGEISRKDNLSQLIGILEASNIRFKFNKRTITVMP